MKEFTRLLRLLGPYRRDLVIGCLMVLVERTSRKIPLSSTPRCLASREQMPSKARMMA